MGKNQHSVFQPADRAGHRTLRNSCAAREPDDRLEDRTPHRGLQPGPSEGSPHQPRGRRVDIESAAPSRWSHQAHRGNGQADRADVAVRAGEMLVPVTSAVLRNS